MMDSTGRSHSTETRTAVLDTNIWLDQLVFEDSRVVPVFGAVAAGALQPVHSRAMRDELADVLRRPALQQHALRVQRRAGRTPAGFDPETCLARFDALSVERPDAGDCGLGCRDPDDQKFLDLAVAQRCTWLVSKDRALLDLARAARRRFALTIVAPGSFATA
jgi:predicted nucleic acid-binding protein